MFSHLITILVLVSNVAALDNGLALTPPMGWLSWERFRCNIDCDNDPDNCISEKLYMQMADRLVADGYRDAGYKYVNIDDCWPAKERDANDRLVPDPKRFPNGIDKLAAYMHDRGLKLGIYEDAGKLTCGGYPGSEFFLETDAQTFADWGVDMLKLDGCYSYVTDYPFEYPIMEFWLNKTGRPILYSCSWPAYIVGSGKIPDYGKIASTCNIWRNYGDIQDSWDSVKDILAFYGNNSGNFSAYAKPGSFNDPDMLIIGNFALSYDQQRVQMAMWAIMAAPLLMSNDLRAIRPESKDLLLNRNLIAINQDSLGIQGNRIVKNGNTEIWRRPVMPSGSFAIAFLNFGESTPVKVSTTLTAIGLNNANGYNVTEGFTAAPLAILKPSDTLTGTVNPSGVFLVKATIL